MNLRDPLCIDCPDSIESVIHVLRDCDARNFVWCSLVKATYWDSFFGICLQDWIQMNLRSDYGHEENKHWKELRATTCHSLWYCRNKKLHDEDYLMSTVLSNDIRSKVQSYNLSLGFQHLLNNKKHTLIQIQWRPPPTDWNMINVDGVVKGNEKTGRESLLRDNVGNWQGCFTKNIDTCNVAVTELWRILEGLKFAFVKGYKKVQLQPDSKVPPTPLKSTNQT